MHNVSKTLSLYRDKGSAAGTLSVEFNDLCFELSDEERAAIGGGALRDSSTSGTVETGNHTPNNVGGGAASAAAVVSGMHNQMEGLSVVERLPEQQRRNPSPTPQGVEQESGGGGGRSEGTVGAAMVGGGGSQLVTGSRADGPASLVSSSAAPSPSYVSGCGCVWGG